jgi:hypothetical protein
MFTLVSSDARCRGTIAVLTSLLPLLASPVVLSGDPVRGPDGHFYIAIESRGIIWNSANQAAMEMSNFGEQGHLATVRTAEEDRFIEDLRYSLFGAECCSPGEFWLGGYQLDQQVEPAGGWVWINDDGPIEGYTNWFPGEPNDWSVSGPEKFLALGIASSFGWSDEGFLGNIAGFIVEFDSGLFADAGPDQEKSACFDVVQLDGSGSLPGTALLDWTLLSKPAGSVAAIADPAARSPTFFADVPGTYVVQLTVSSTLPSAAVAAPAVTLW